MNIPTVQEYQARPEQPIRSDLGFAVWVLAVTRDLVYGLPPSFRKEWKHFLQDQISQPPTLISP